MIKPDGVRDEILGNLLKAIDHVESAHALAGPLESSGLGIQGVLVDLQDIYEKIDDGRLKR